MQLITTINDYAFTVIHTSQFTRRHTYFSGFRVFTSLLFRASNCGCFLSSGQLTVLFITSWHGLCTKHFSPNTPSVVVSWRQHKTPCVLPFIGGCIAMPTVYQLASSCVYRRYVATGLCWHHTSWLEKICCVIYLM